MASNKSMFQKPVFWVTVVGLGVAGYAMTTPTSSKPSTTPKSVAKKKVSVKKGDVVFTKEDEQANFAAVNESPRNAFVPIVARHGGFGSGDGLANAIPTDMTGGEGNWVYTGTASTDGVPVALIENRTTGDAVFLKRGERWKSAYVVRITEYSVIMSGPSGTRTLGLVDETLKGSSTLARSQDYAPAQIDVPGNFRGRIGRGGFQNGLSAVPNQGQFGQLDQPGFPANEPNQ